MVMSVELDMTFSTEGMDFKYTGKKNKKRRKKQQMFLINVDMIFYPSIQMYYQRRGPLKLHEHNKEIRETLLKLQKVAWLVNTE